MQEIEEFFACEVRYTIIYGVVEFKYATSISDGAKGVAMATKLGKNKPTLHRFQFCTSYGDNASMYSRVFEVGEYKYANKNYKGTKLVATETKFTQIKNKNAQISVLYAI